MQLKNLLLFTTLIGCHADSPQTTTASWGVPITGGTMLVTRDGLHAVIADPDRSRILDVDLDTEKVVAEVALQANDEPGRIVEDSAGRIHVALRRGGAVVTMTDGASGQIAFRRAVCPEPRGLAYDPIADVIHVACTGGELVTFPAAGGDAIRTLHLDRDLRDIVVVPNQLIVTRFRSAEILTLDSSGNIISRVVPPNVTRLDEGGGGPAQNGNTDTGIGSLDAIPAVAWRTIALPDGRVLVSHQRQLDAPLDAVQGGYGHGCGGPIEAAISVMQPGTAPITVAPVFSGALPVDVAINRTGDTLAFVLAGAKNVQQIPTTALATPDQGQAHCGGDGSGSGSGSGSNTGPTPDIVQVPPNPNPDMPTGLDSELGAPTSVDFKVNGDMVVFYPEYPALVVHSGTAEHLIALTGAPGYDAGRALFHAETSVGLACASCHPEARDDGLVWSFTNVGQRRTQSLAGHLLDRAPYHWSGDLADVPTLMNAVFTVRMNGGPVTDDQVNSLGPWLDRIPAAQASPASDPAAVARGQALFESPAQACTTCHNGPLMTNKLLVDVGTGGVFKVPSLIAVGARAPFMHTGCAATLTSRFDPTCGGGESHGHTALLSSDQINDLIAYLNSL